MLELASGGSSGNADDALCARERGCNRLGEGPGQRGRAPDPHRLNRLFYMATRMAGLPPIRLRDVRHSHVSAALAAGVDLEVRQERLGHSTVATTADLYVHVPSHVDLEVADRTADYIFRASCG